MLQETKDSKERAQAKADLLNQLAQADRKLMWLREHEIQAEADKTRIYAQLDEIERADIRANIVALQAQIAEAEAKPPGKTKTAHTNREWHIQRLRTDLARLERELAAIGQRPSLHKIGADDPDYNCFPVGRWQQPAPAADNAE